MGLDPSILHRDQITRLLSPADRKAAGVKTAAESRKDAIQRSEKDLHKEVRNLLNLHGIPFCEARMDRKSSITIGWPDITFARDGVPIAWELKFLGSLSPEQVAVKERMEKHGWHYRVIRSLTEAREHLRELAGEPSALRWKGMAGRLARALKSVMGLLWGALKYGPLAMDAQQALNEYTEAAGEANQCAKEGA